MRNRLLLFLSFSRVSLPGELYSGLSSQFAAMAKKGTPRRKGMSRKGERIDMLPKLSQKPRSSPPKRRTDLSLFFTYPDSPTNFDISALWRQSFSRVGLSTMAMSCLDDLNEENTKHLDSSPVVWSESDDSRLRLCSNASRDPMGSNESVTYDASLDPLSDSSLDEQSKGTAKILEFDLHKSGVAAESSGVCVDPGSVVWAKTAGQMWWPGEIMGESSMLDDSNHQGTNGHVLVQFYGSNQIAWVDPARDLTQLEDCYEERSSNPIDEFQEALRLALNRKEQLTSSTLLFKSNDSDDSHQQDQSYDKWSSSISSRVGDDDTERGRGKREKKPKVHFDEVVFTPKSSRQLRQLRIMRNLGLTAPVGSPF